MRDHHGYDINKWTANEAVRRPRRYWARWGLVGGLLLVLAIPIVEMTTPSDRGHPWPEVAPLSMLLIISGLFSPFVRRSWLTQRTIGAGERDALSLAARRAYLVGTVGIAILFVWLAWTSYVGGFVPQTPRQWLAIGYAVVLVLLALPATFAEFLVPIPDRHDDRL